MSDKAQASTAAERIERGLDLYAAGDLAGSRREFEEALKLDPAQARALECLGWIRDLLEGRRRLAPSRQALDEDALRAVDAALEDEVRLLGRQPTPARDAISRDAIPPPESPDPLLREPPGGVTLREAPSLSRPERLLTREAHDELLTRPGPPLPLTALEPASSQLEPASSQAPPDPSLDAQWDPVPLLPATAEQPVMSSAPPPQLVPKKRASSPRVPVAQTPVKKPPDTLDRVTAVSSDPIPLRPESDAQRRRTFSGDEGSGPHQRRTLSGDELVDPHRRHTWAGDPPSQPRAPAPSGSTLPGMQPGTPPQGSERQRLSPTPRPLPAVEDPPESVTREWNAVPTGTNLPPLDVPELTEEQVHELLALDTPLLAGSERNTSVDAEPPGQVLELEAEPPGQELETEPTRTARSRSSPDLGARVGRDARRPQDYDDQTPTRDRSAQLRAMGTAPTLAGVEVPELALLPMDSLADESSDSGRQPTNPFVQSHLDPDAEPAPLGARPATPADVEDALAHGELGHALALVEELIADAGALDAEAVRAAHPLFEQVYHACIGDLEVRPRHGRVTPDLDPRSAFLLSRLDGTLTFEDLLDVSGMPRLEAMRTLALMLVRGVVLLPP